MSDDYQRSMSDYHREEYQRRVRELAALRAETTPKRSLRQRITDLLARTPVAPPQRISGPRLMPDWHTPAVNRTLPLAGPRCLNPDCRLSMLPGSGLLSEREGFCGQCQKHGRAIPSGQRAPQVEDDGPNQAA